MVVEMRKYIVMPIGRIMALYPQICEKLGCRPPVIVATLIQDYYWEDVFEPIIHFDIGDVGKNHPMFITKDDVKELEAYLPMLKKSKYVIVGCDAGISRSSAIAYSLAKIFDEKEEIKLLRYWFPYRNQDMVEFITKNIKGIYNDAQRTLQTA